MLLADVVRTSSLVSGTSSRISKVSLIAELLRQCARQVAEGTSTADELALAARYLSGSLRQRRTGVEQCHQDGSPGPAPPGFADPGREIAASNVCV